MNKERLITLALIILAAAASRLLPHPQNVAPIAAIALFSGAQFEKKWLAFFVPLCAMLLSDVIIGFYAQMWVTYVGFAVVVCIGFALQGHVRLLNVAAGTLAASLVFYLITNFGPLIHGNMYPNTGEGIVTGYVMGLPFLWNTLLGDMFYSALLFGSFAFAEITFPFLQPAPQKAKI